MVKDNYDLCDINDLKALLEGNGFRFSKALGQNFLVDRTVPERIAEASLADKYVPYGLVKENVTLIG